MVQFDTFVKVINGEIPMTKVTPNRPATTVPVVKVYKAPSDTVFTFGSPGPHFTVSPKIYLAAL